MTEARSFPFPALSGKRSHSPDEPIDEFLENLTPAAVVIHERSGRIEAANSRFFALIELSATEVTGQPLDTWLPGWENGVAPLQVGLTPGTPRSSSDPSDTGGITQPLARITPAPFAPKGKRLLLVHTPGKAANLPQQTPPIHDFFSYVNRLAETRQMYAAATALEATLAAAQALTGATALGVYRLQADRPALKLHTAIDAGGVLPVELPAQEMIQLNRPRAWEAGRRPACGLHRLARSAQLKYLVSAPLGQERALVGLVVFGGIEPPVTGLEGLADAAAVELALPAVRLLATVITGIFEQHGRVENLELERQVQEREIRLETSFETYANEGVLVLDAELRIQRLNPAAEAMMGYASPEVAGERVDKVLIGPEALLPALQEALEGSPTYNLGNVRLYRRNGESFLALMRLYPISHAGQVEHVLALIQDLTEQEQIRIQTQQLEQRALLGEVTAVFAHEVRNPINNISTGLQVLAMNLPADDPNQAAVARMLADCDRLAELFKSVLAYSKPMDYEMEPLDVGGLLNRLLERLHPRIVRQNVQYSLRVEDDCPRVMGNLRALEQVFNNLIGNALQAMGEGGHLIIKAWEVSEDGQKQLEVSIADTGPGIPRENLERVFQPFFTTQKETGGTGLGLAIVKRIVTAHKGNITVTSFPGGTIFRVRLPVEEG